MFSTSDMLLCKSALTSELDRELGDLQVDIANHESRIMLRLVQMLLSHTAALVRLLDRALLLDVLLSLSTVAQEQGWVRPTLHATSSLLMTRGRHPLYELCCRDEYVPNDARSGAGAAAAASRADSGHVQHICIVTGPNGSGKTVYLKTVGVVALLAQVGSFVPAESLAMKPFNAVLVVAPCLPSVTSAFSSFLLELNQLARALQESRCHCLLLIDEFGSTTYENDGSAVLLASLHHLMLRRACPQPRGSVVLPTPVTRATDARNPAVERCSPREGGEAPVTPRGRAATSSLKDGEPSLKGALAPSGARASSPRKYGSPCDSNKPSSSGFSDCAGSRQKLSSFGDFVTTANRRVSSNVSVVDASSESAQALSPSSREVTAQHDIGIDCSNRSSIMPFVECEVILEENESVQSGTSGATSDVADENSSHKSRCRGLRKFENFSSPRVLTSQTEIQYCALNEKVPHSTDGSRQVDPAISPQSPSREMSAANLSNSSPLEPPGDLPHVFVSTHLLTLFDYIQHPENVSPIVLKTVLSPEGDLVPLHQACEGRCVRSEATRAAGLAGLPGEVVRRALQVEEALASGDELSQWDQLQHSDESALCHSFVSRLLQRDLAHDNICPYLGVVESEAKRAMF